MNILKEINIKNWQEEINASLQQEAITSLENDSILFFPDLNFELNDDEKYLLTPEFSDLKSKNISYHCKDHSLRGMNSDPTAQEKMKSLIARFHQYAYEFVCQLFPAYVPHLEVGRTSYRPIEIRDRHNKSYKKDDTRLHVDAFPSNPVQGRRILRVFSNINPQGRPRVWHAGESFSTVARQFLPRIKKPVLNGKLLKLLHITKSVRTPYDHIMLQLHDQMKADEYYQAHVKKTQIQFPAGSTWIVQTDSVSHAALSGQYVLEQTFYLPVSAMVNENLSPLRVLENLTASSLC